ncbi:MAG: TonB-dependent receptor plug domain-containing protein [Chitinivibrionia bacterium]|nr:TonB-dependent receptor plug domain-containing protein [Chitinivibrionia bacterium]
MDTMIVVENKDIERQDEHIRQVIENRDFKTRGLASVLAFESGIQRDRQRSVGSFERFSIRGISGDRVGVFVNGVSVANSGGRAVDLSRFNGLNISQIDVYRNFVPAYLGGNTFGGAINIITDNADVSLQEFFLLFGSFGEIHSFANINNIPLSERTSLSLFLDFHRAKNDFKYLDENGTFFGIGHRDDDTVRRMDNNEFLGATISGNVRSRQRRFDIDGNFSIFDSRHEIPSPAGVRYRFRNQTAFDANTEYIFSINQQFHNAAESRINLAYLLSLNEFNWTYRDNFAFPYSLLRRGGRGKVSAKNNAFDFGHSHNFSLGNNLIFSLNNTGRYENIVYSNDITGFNISDREVSRLNAALSGDLRIFTPAPEIILGATIRGYSDKISSWERGFVYRDIVDTATFEHDKSFRLSIKNDFLRAPITVFADAIYAEKVPNLRQRYGFFGIIPSTDLRPEKIYSFQIGALADIFSVRTRTAFFANFCEDLIRIVYFGNVGKALNVSNTRNFGFENDIFWRVAPILELSNNITFQNPRNLSEKSTRDLYIPAESKLRINSQAEVGDFAGWSLISRYSYLSAYYHDLFNVHRVPFNDSMRGLSFFSFILQHQRRRITAQVGVYDILASGNSPEKLTALESGYFPIRYPGMTIKGSVLWTLRN